MFSTVPAIDCAGRKLLLDRPRIVGVVNVTPDSFSDGGSHNSLESALAYALRLVDQGADMLDVGGESTRPGAVPVGEAEEIARVVPLIEALVSSVTVPIAIDTSKPAVMRAAVHAGAGLINDVFALRQLGALEAAVELGVPVCLMHMQGVPGSMQAEPTYDDVVADVHRFLAERIFACEMSGIPKTRILVDPGFGFGKTLEHNLTLLGQLKRFSDLGVPLMAGLSRKSMIGTITGRPLLDRAVGSAAAALLAAQNGAMLLRVHDVVETVDALAVLLAAAPFQAKQKASIPATVPRWGDDD